MRHVFFFQQVRSTLKTRAEPKKTNFTSTLRWNLGPPAAQRTPGGGAYTQKTTQSVYIPCCLTPGPKDTHTHTHTHTQHQRFTTTKFDKKNKETIRAPRELTTRVYDVFFVHIHRYKKPPCMHARTCLRAVCCGGAKKWTTHLTRRFSTHARRANAHSHIIT